MHEDKENNLVHATFELPGLKKEDVNIDVHNNRLTISGESKISSERDENGYAVRERRYGKFSRSLALPQGIKVCPSRSLLRDDDADQHSHQPEEVKASLEDGVLTVTFPKATPEQAPKKITIA